MITEHHFKNQEFDYVYHLADVHIRNLKRHREYKEVLTTFLDNVKKDNIDKSLIYIGGDIVHSKTEMSPELIQMVSWFLNECANLKPTLVITGNHDCNHKNPSRLDALAPIIYNLKNENLFYLKDTGVYTFGDLTFGVYSILDQKENWPKGTDIKGKHKICLFHGPVDKSLTDVGYEVSSRNFTVDIFDGYHIAMLGDIHKRQVIQEYNSKENKPIIVYSSSLIQQNHGETLENHGYLLWDVKKRKYTEHNLKNNWGYVTIDIHQNEIPEWVYDEIKSGKLPKHPRLRVRFSETEISDIHLRISELQSLFSVSEISYTRGGTLQRTGQQIGIGDNDTLNNIRDITTQNTLISEYLLSNYDIGDSLVHSVCELNEELNKELTSDDVLDKNIIWVPKSFEFSNMFSYGENNKVDFTDLKGLIGLFAPNTAGKSSLFSSLSFCIFDKSERAFKASQILNNRKNEFYCKFHFTINDVDYFIERIAKKSKRGTVKVDVNFWKLDSEGEIVSLNGEQRRETNAVIERYMGTYDDFILTTLSLQGNNALFIDKSQTERKEILSKFIGIDILDELYTMASDRSKEISSLVKNFKNENYSEKLSEVLTDIRDLTEQYTDIKEQSDLMEEEEDSYILKIEQLTEQLISLSDGIKDINELQTDKTKNENQINTTKQKIDEIQSSIDTLKSTLDDRLQLRVKIETDGKIEEKYKRYNELKNEVSLLDHKIEKIDIELKSELNRIETHKDYEYDPNCDYCIKNSQTIINIRNSANERISVLSGHKNKVVKQKTEIQTQLNELTNIETLWVNYISLKDEITTLQRKVDTETSSKLNNERLLDNLLNEQEKIEKNIDLYYTHEKSIKWNNELRTEISELKEELQSVRLEIKENESLLLDINSQLSSMKNQKEFIISQINKIKKLEEDSLILEYYLDCVKRDGLPYTLISTILPYIEAEVNNILSQIVEFTMNLTVDGKNINALLNYDGQEWPLELSSGMERFISGLAIRVALMNICNLPRPQFLVIDEGLGSLDHDNLQSIFMMFDYLKTQYEFIILISHLETSRDIVDKLIEIKKENGFSSINV